MCHRPWHTAKYAATWAPNQDFAVCHTVGTRQTSPLRRVPRARGTQRSRPRRRQLRPTPFVIFISPCAMNNTRRIFSPCARYMTHGEDPLRRASGCRRRFAVGHPRRSFRRVLNGLRRVPLAHGEMRKSGSGKFEWSRMAMRMPLANGQDCYGMDRNSSPVHGCRYHLAPGF